MDSELWLTLSLKHSDWIDSSTSFRILDSTDLRWACPNAYSDFVAAVSLRLVVPGPDQPCTYIPNNMDSQWFNVDRILGTHLA